MKSILTAALGFLLLAPSALSQTPYQWHRFYGSASAKERAYSTAFDSAGNIYTTGMSEATWDGPGSQSPLHAHTGNIDAFILKLGPSGAYQWHTFFGGSGSFCYGYDITTDSADNVYITGFSYSSWNGPTGQDPRHAFSGAGSDIFVLKLDSNGAYQWHTFFGSGSDYHEGSGITHDSSNNVYVSGFSESAWLGPSSQAPLHGFSGTGREMFVLKLDSAGAYQWHTFYGAADANDESFSIAADPSDNLLVGGYSAMTWNGPAAQSPKHPHSGGKDIVILKLGNDGSYQWHTFYGSSASDEVRGIKTDDAGNVYACGNSSGSWQGDGSAPPLHPYAGAADHVVLKLDASGNYLWHTFYGTAGDNDYANQLVLDANDNVYVGGRSYGPWLGDRSTSPVHAYSGYRDISVFSLTSNGAYRWHTFYGSTGDDRGLGIGLYDNSLVVVGGSTASWTGDGGAAPLNAFAGGGRDAFVLSLNPAAIAAALSTVPALDEWALIVLMLLLATAGFVTARMR